MPLYLHHRLLNVSYVLSLEASPMDILAFSLLLATLFTHPFVVPAESIPPISSRITVVGAVYCDTCLNQGFSRYSYFIPGADVHIECKFKADSPKTAEMITFSGNRSTDNYGVYKLEIPSVDGVDCIDGPPIQSFCQATLIGSSSEACNVPALKATTNEISVKSKQESLCVYSFTPLSFRPSKRNNTLCQKQADKSLDSIHTSKFSWPNLPTSSILRAFGSFPTTFNLRDPTTWKPLFPPANPQKQNP